MSNDKALTRKLERSLTQSSTLDDFVRAKTSEQVFLLVDTSGSMDQTLLLPDGTLSRRIDQVRRVNARIQSQQPTPIIAFGDLGFNPETYSHTLVDFVTEIPEPSGMTPMAQAIDFAREKGAGRLVILSDGQPDSTHDANEAARRFGGRIDIVFIGEPGGHGSSFLLSLAELAGGSQFEGDLSDPLALAGNVIGLLKGEVLEIDDDEEDEEDEEDEDLDDDD